MFNIRYFNYAHKDGRTGTYSPGPYSLPPQVAQHVDLVSGIVGFPNNPRVVPKIRQNAPQSGKPIDPVVIRTRYNTSVICTNANSSHAVAEFQAQYYSPTDLSTFWKNYVPFAPFKPVAKVVGVNQPSSPGIEASLDIQYIMGVAPNATTWFYSMAQFNFWNDLVTWSALLNNETTLPYVHSVSYGAQGDDPDSAYQNRLDAEFQKLGVRGVSVMFASGDDGSGCSDGDYDGPVNDACDCMMNPSFPATCPHVTSVGATRFLTGNSGPEGAVQAFGSGGGFSTDDFPVQSFQQADVQAYLSSGIALPEPCSFNSSGRATPDVSALGDVYFQVVNGGSTISVGGTSASSPTFSAIITLLNDLRFNHGKSSLGFLNPLIYQIASTSTSAFFDVTNGNNIVGGCCSGGGEDGFLCAKGWDPVSGVGTPNYEALAPIVLALP